jgi:hypothetical protein
MSNLVHVDSGRHLEIRERNRKLREHKQYERTHHHNRVRGPMARRLTTNQEIAGSIPAVLILFCLMFKFLHVSYCFVHRMFMHHFGY